jgi:uncharacterized membrane protein
MRRSETARVEAFSDAVFAIAITLLSLELRVPHEPGVSLARGLLALWPEYVAFALSFLTIGGVWLNHHRLFNFVRHVDYGLLVWNGLLLMAVTVVPFTNAILSEYLENPGERTAAVVYSGMFIVVTGIFRLLWGHVTRWKLRTPLPPAVVRRVERRYATGLALYGVAFIIGFFSARASVAADLLLAFFFVVPFQTKAVRTQKRRHAAVLSGHAQPPAPRHAHP